MATDDLVQRENALQDSIVTLNNDLNKIGRLTTHLADERTELEQLRDQLDARDARVRAAIEV